QARARGQLDEPVAARRERRDGRQAASIDAPAGQAHAREPAVGGLVQAQCAGAAVRPLTDGGTAWVHRTTSSGMTRSHQAAFAMARVPDFRSRRRPVTVARPSRPLTGFLGTIALAPAA